MQKFIARERFEFANGARLALTVNTNFANIGVAVVMNRETLRTLAMFAFSFQPDCASFDVSAPRVLRRYVPFSEAQRLQEFIAEVIALARGTHALQQTAKQG